QAGAAYAQFDGCRYMAHRFEEESLALVRLDPADGDDLVAVPIVAKPFRGHDRRVQWRGGNSIEARQAIGNHLRIGEHAAGLLNRLRVEINQSVAERPSTRIIRHHSVRTVPEIVEGANVVNEPQNLVGVVKHVARRSKSNESVARIGEIDQA